MTSIRIEKSGERMDKLKNAEDPSVVYADIINLPHHQSDTHPHMSLYDRAAQFAPFAALSGYDAMVAEEARYTDQQIELSDSKMELLNRKLSLLSTVLSAGEHPELTFVYFLPDRRKEGGSYTTATGVVKKVDSIRRRIVFYDDNDVSDGDSIDLGAVLEIHGELVDSLEEE